MAIRMTSRGREIINSPFRENITKIVKSKNINERGAIRGMKRLSYQSLPLSRMPILRVLIPATNGIPRYVRTLEAIVVILTVIALPISPKSFGKMEIKIYA